MDKDVLDVKADMTLVTRLYKEGLLNNEAYQAACKLLNPIPDWYKFARQMLLYLGAALVLAGIIFFFAYNWADMNKFIKLGLVEAGIVGCVGAAYIHGISKLTSKILILSASVLVGVLLAVFGQIYQTGADAYELFTGWAVLILGWVLISKFAALWFVWLIILNIGMSFYWEQVGYPVYSIDYRWLYLTLACVDGIALIVRELGTTFKFSWLDKGWLRVFLFTVVLTFLTIPVIDQIIGYRHYSWSDNIIVLVWICCLVSGFYFYRYKRKNINLLALVSFDICVVLLTLIGKMIFKNYFDDSFELMLLFFSIIVLGVFAGAGYWLRHMGRKISQERQKEEV